MLVCSRFMQENKGFMYCFVGFVANTSSMVSLVMSANDLAWSYDKPWMPKQLAIVCCIGTTIICMSLKDSLAAFYENHAIGESAI